MRTTVVRIFISTLFFIGLFIGPLAQGQEADRSFDESDALSIVLDAVYDASFDFEGIYHITHNIDYLTEKKQCEVVESYELVDHFERIFAEFISYYPDEELPFDQAIQDLHEISANRQFQRCFEHIEQPYGFVEVTHFESLSSPLWIRIEYRVGC